MLSGIKVGKKKKKVPVPPPSTTTDPTEIRGGNDAAAEALRQQLAGGGHPQEVAQKTVPTILIPERPTASSKKEEDMSIQELLVHEKSQMSLAEQESRSILRNGKRPRAQPNDDSSDDEANHWKPPDPSKAARRDRDRQIHQHRRTHGLTQACWWWVESTRFAPDRVLLAASPQVTLVLNARGVLPGKHFYLVPIPNANSWTACDENVWVELRHFQKSLRSMAKANGEAVIFWETVLSKGKGVWQTRMDTLFVPPTVLQDAPLYFRSALAEQAQEFGTHQKLMTVKKSLKACVPPRFSYFYVEYGEYDGHLQMIENDSFPSDFGADTIAGMMELDPMKFRNSKSAVDEKKLKDTFLDGWARFDWTTQNPTGGTTDKQKP